jgi:hypothetical protein
MKFLLARNHVSNALLGAVMVVENDSQIKAETNFTPN